MYVKCCYHLVVQKSSRLLWSLCCSLFRLCWYSVSAVAALAAGSAAVSASARRRRVAAASVLARCGAVPAPRGTCRLACVRWLPISPPTHSARCIENILSPPHTKTLVSYNVIQVYRDSEVKVRCTVEVYEPAHTHTDTRRARAHTHAHTICVHRGGAKLTRKTYDG